MLSLILLENVTDDYYYDLFNNHEKCTQLFIQNLELRTPEHGV